MHEIFWMRPGIKGKIFDYVSERDKKERQDEYGRGYMDNTFQPVFYDITEEDIQRMS